MPATRAYRDRAARAALGARRARGEATRRAPASQRRKSLPGECPGTRHHLDPVPASPSQRGMNVAPTRTSDDTSTLQIAVSPPPVLAPMPTRKQFPDHPCMKLFGSAMPSSSTSVPAATVTMQLPRQSPGTTVERTRPGPWTSILSAYVAGPPPPAPVAGSPPHPLAIHMVNPATNNARTRPPCRAFRARKGKSMSLCRQGQVSPLTSGRAPGPLLAVLLGLRRRRRLVAPVPAALLRQRFLARQPDLPGPVHGDHLHQDLVAFLEHVLHLLHPRVGEIRDVHEPVGAGEDLHERAELHDPPHGAEIGLPHLRLLRERADHLDRLLHALAVGRGDGHLPVVLDVDAGSGAGDDVLDHLASRPDHVLDPADRNADGSDLRRVLGDVGARLLDRLRHLAQDVEPPLARLVERAGEDLPVHAGDLDVHLDGGDALRGAAHLEVHVAQVVLVAEDVGEDRDPVL